MPWALVFGQGLAGLSCAKILARQGWDVEIWGAVPRASPILVLNDVTCGLLHDIWQAGNEPLQSAHAINQRKVCWGADGAVSVVAQSSAVIRGDLLVTRLLESLSQEHFGQVRVAESPAYARTLMGLPTFRSFADEFDWIIDAGGRASHVAQELGAKHCPFGRRHAISVEVSMEKSGERHA